MQHREIAQHIDKTNNIEEVNSMEETVQHMILENDITNVEINKKIKTLLMQLQKSEEENRKILKEKEILKQENKQFNMEVTKLQAEITKMTTDIQKQADIMPVEVLKKVFTSGQIEKFKSSTNSRIHWSPEDIVSAIGLRALSPKAYRYLRNVKNILLPCESTLQNWIAKFNLIFYQAF